MYLVQTTFDYKLFGVSVKERIGAWNQTDNLVTVELKKNNKSGNDFKALNHFLAIFCVFVWVDVSKKQSKDKEKHSGISHASFNTLLNKLCMASVIVETLWSHSLQSSVILLWLLMSRLILLWFHPFCSYGTFTETTYKQYQTKTMSCQN